MVTADAIGIIKLLYDTSLMLSVDIGSRGTKAAGIPELICGGIEGGGTGGGIKPGGG